jgi:guanylate kinase
MGKSSSGKDSIYNRLIGDKELNLEKIIGYTTRPKREGEENGREYFFTDEVGLSKIENDGILIEKRIYNTVYGDWTYFTADDGQINLNKNNYILIGTLESYEKVRKYYGEDKVIPVYINIDDGERLLRAINREKKQKNPGYEELCRRFLADARDFSKENLERLGIDTYYLNDDIDECLESIKELIREKMR